MDTFSWNASTGAGLPRVWRPKRQSPTVRSEKNAGYVQTRRKWTRNLWVFEAQMPPLEPNNYVYLAEFFEAHYGGDLFYLQWPIGMYGLPPEYGGVADPGSTDMWDTGITTGYGEGIIHIVRFGMDELAADYNEQADLWYVTDNLIFEQA